VAVGTIFVRPKNNRMPFMHHLTPAICSVSTRWTSKQDYLVH